MPELRSLLEREIATIPPPEYSLGDVASRRDGRRRNERLRAAALALLIAAAAIWGLVHAVGDQSSIPAHPRPFPGGGRWVRMDVASSTFAKGDPRVVIGWHGGYLAVGDVSGSYVPGSGNTSPVWRSADGLTWSPVPSRDAPDSASLWDVASGHGGLVAVGVGPGGPAAWWSPDGRTWTPSRVDLPSRIEGNADFMSNVISTDFGFIATGRLRGDAYVWTSTNGRDWASVPNEAVFGGEGGQSISAVTAGGPGFVAVGGEGRHGARTAAPVVWTSPDGSTWTRQTPVGQGLRARGYTGMATIFVGGPGLVAFGNGLWGPPAEWTSPDGITWRRVRDRSVPPIRAVIRSEGGFEGVGDRGIWTSADGVRWTLDAPASIDSEFESIASGARGLLTVGWGNVGPHLEIWIKSVGR